MADFVAVIRRAVDGLSDNTPEMRVKVYEKARGAVLRQLEGMKPRPPEEMLRRQLEKLESAIQEVETEHTIAEPAPVEEMVAEPEPAPVAAAPEPVYQPETQPEPEVEAAPEPAPVPVAVQPVEPEPAAYVPPAPVEPAYEPVVAAEPVAVEPEPVAWVEPAPEPEEAPAPAPVSEAVAADQPVVVDELAPVEAVLPAATVVAEPAPVTTAPQAVASAPNPVATAPNPVAAPAAKVFLFGDESWAGEDETPAPAPAVAPVIPVAEPVDLLPEPVAVDVPAPAPAENTTLLDADPYADFPVEEPTAKYSQTAPVEPEPALDWPEQGMETVATAQVPAEEWSAPAVAVEAPIVLEPVSDPQPFSLGPESGHVVEDPFAWQTEPYPEPVVEAAVAPIDNVIHADFTHHRQDDATVSDDNLNQAEISTEYTVVLDPPVALDPAPVALDPAPVVPDPAPVNFDPAPAETDLLAGDDWDNSPFEEKPAVAADVAAGRSDRRAWDDYDDFGAPKAVEIPDPGFEEFDPDAFQPLEKPARSYRIQPKRRFDFTSIGLGLLGLLIVAGAGYGAWSFRDTLSGLVTGLVSTPPAEDAAKSATAKPASDAAQPETATKPAATAGNAAPAEPELQKFTQRLRADGTEVDEGKANGTGTGEGKTVAEQTVASAVPETTPPVPNSTTKDQTAIPVGVAQKMFLYEERVGQTSPVAIEGGVVWSVKTEPGENGKPETEVQGQVTTGDRGLSALITFKRNMDPSLPASHLVELVFSLPPNFDGGAIESVQRVAFKQTEQDRGDALVAVPAKITDDFHMIALNDFADARAFNLKLMQTRDWIDIPIAYRNGRRGLLTMQKGTTGTEAFNQALAAWAAEEPAAAAAPANPQ